LKMAIAAIRIHGVYIIPIISTDTSANLEIAKRAQ